MQLQLLRASQSQPKRKQVTPGYGQLFNRSVGQTSVQGGQSIRFPVHGCVCRLRRPYCDALRIGALHKKSLRCVRYSRERIKEETSLLLSLNRSKPDRVVAGQCICKFVARTAWASFSSTKHPSSVGLKRPDSTPSGPWRYSW